jgi:prepilin-type N-terminal cleavage/methylation domain-containing protein
MQNSKFKIGVLQATTSHNFEFSILNFEFARGASRARRGFTLLELVLTLVITGTLLASLTVIVMSTAEIKVRLESETRARKMGPAILEIIARDLRNAWATSKANAKSASSSGTSGTSGTGGTGTTDGTTTTTDTTGAADVGVEGSFFKGEHKGDDDAAMDELWFVTSVDSYMRYHGIRSDLTEVGYYVNKDSETGLNRLYRREDFSVDSRPDEGGLGVKLTDRLVSFRVFYYEKPKEGADAKDYEEVVKRGGDYEKDEWDAEEQKRLPYAIRIELVLDVTPLDAFNRKEQRRIGVYETIVRLPDFPDLDDKFKLYQLALPSDKPADTKKEETKK